MDKIKLGKKLKIAREAAHLSQLEAAEKYGCTASAISQRESADCPTDLDALEKFSAIYGPPIEWFLSDSMETPPLPKPTLKMILKDAQEAYEALELVSIPVRGAVPAGIPCIEEQETGEMVDVPKYLLEGITKEDELYALNVKGDSLIGDGILPGFKVIIQPDVEIINGKIYVIRLGNEVCVRHVFKMNDHLKLKSSNGKYQEIAAKDVEILGRVVASGIWNKH